MDYEWLHNEGLPEEYRQKKDAELKSTRYTIHQFIIDRTIYDALQNGVKMKEPYGINSRRAIKTLVDSGVKIKTAHYVDANGVDMTIADKNKLPRNWQKMFDVAGKKHKSEDWICLQLGISRYVWEALLHESKEFGECYARYRQLLKCTLEDMGYDLATGESKGSTAAWKFFMANKFGWSDRTEQTVQQTVQQQAKNASELSDEELKEECEHRGLPTNVFEVV